MERKRGIHPAHGGVFWEDFTRRRGERGEDKRGMGWPGAAAACPPVLGHRTRTRTRSGGGDFEYAYEYDTGFEAEDFTRRREERGEDRTGAGSHVGLGRVAQRVCVRFVWGLNDRVEFGFGRWKQAKRSPQRTQRAQRESQQGLAGMARGCGWVGDVGPVASLFHSSTTG